MAKHETKGGINYWLESMIMINEYKKMPGGSDRFLEVRYEDLVANPKVDVTRILEFVNEDPKLFDFNKVSTHKEKDKYRKILTESEISYVKQLCEPFYSQYGYK
jgi:hypothetical protein